MCAHIQTGNAQSYNIDHCDDKQQWNNPHGAWLHSPDRLFPYLQEPVEGHPEEEDVSDHLDKGESAVDHPICQPFCVVILTLSLNCLHPNAKKYIYML